MCALPGMHTLKLDDGEGSNTAGWGHQNMAVVSCTGSSEYRKAISSTTSASTQMDVNVSALCKNHLDSRTVIHLYSDKSAQFSDGTRAVRDILMSMGDFE